MKQTIEEKKKIAGAKEAYWNNDARLGNTFRYLIQQSELTKNLCSLNDMSIEDYDAVRDIYEIEIKELIRQHKELVLLREENKRLEKELYDLLPEAE